jgi:hypothetical protein
VIVELFLIPLLFLLFTGWGCWAKQLLFIENKLITISVILGLALYGLLACIIAFFVPLNIPAEIFLLCIGIIPYIFKDFRKYLPPVPKNILKCAWFWGFALTVILAGSYYNFRNDHFWYYVPSLKWLNEYGLITGVANIDWVLGQMSFMHIIQAGVDQTIDPFGRFSIFIVILFLTYIFERKAFLLLLFVPVYFLYFQSPSPDLPTTFFPLIVVNEYCFHYQKNNFRTLFAISIFVFAIKPVAFWLPMWIFIIAFYRNKSELKSIRNYVVPVLLMLVFLVKNVVVSSCLIYPVTFLQIDTHWLPDPQILKSSADQAAVYTFDLYYDIDTINSFSFFEKLYRWLTLPDLQTIINVLIVLIIILFGIISFLKRDLTCIILFFVAVFKFIITFYFSGQYRFILDIIFPMLMILFLFLNLKRLPLLSISLVLYITSLLYVSFPGLGKKIVPSFKISNIMVGLTKESLVYPENYPCDTYKQEKIGNLNFNVPVNDLYKYETPPPSLSANDIEQYYYMGIFPQWKDPKHIHKGFYTKTLSGDEMEALGRMIENPQ